MRGEGIRGQLAVDRAEDGSLRMRIRIERTSGPVPCTPGHGVYTLNLAAGREKIEGSFYGKFNDRPVNGIALGHRFRPIVTTSL